MASPGDLWFHHRSKLRLEAGWRRLKDGWEVELGFALYVACVDGNCGSIITKIPLISWQCLYFYCIQLRIVRSIQIVK